MTLKQSSLKLILEFAFAGLLFFFNSSVVTWMDRHFFVSDSNDTRGSLLSVCIQTFNDMFR